MKRITTLAMGLVVATLSQAQQNMDLRQCIERATEANNSIKQKEIALEKSENSLSTSKGGYMPSVSAYATQAFDFGRGLTVNNTYANQNVHSTSFGVQANMTLFAGLRVRNGVAASRINVEYATADLQAAREEIGIQVAAAYMQAVCDREIADRAQEQVELSRVQLARKEGLLKNGKASEADVAEARSLVAQDEMTAVKAENTYRLSLLSLAQLMELPSPDSLTLMTPDTTIMLGEIAGADQVYQEALGNKASVKAAQKRVEVAEKQISIARGEHAPTLSLGAGIGTSYYGVNGQDNDSFGDQMSNNLNKSIQLQLSVPIFNRLETRNKVREARMDHRSSQVELDEVKKQLYKEIQQAYYNAVAAEATYQSSLAAAASADEAFRLAEGKYAQGVCSATDYAEARTNRLVAISNMIQYKYENIFRNKILDFYRGIEMQ